MYLQYFMKLAILYESIYTTLRLANLFGDEPEVPRDHVTPCSLRPSLAVDPVTDLLQVLPPCPSCIRRSISTLYLGDGTMSPTSRALLHSAGKQEVRVPRTRLVSSDKAFAVAAPKALNRLPVDIKSAVKLDCARNN